ncbi:MAG: SDR family oxidoreductase [Gammaproteobacteria bacterium]
MSDPTGRVALVTNVTQYAGPGSVEALAADGFRIAAHDQSFADAAVRAAFAADHPGWVVLPDADIVAAAGRILADTGRVDVLVSNDYIKPSRTAFDDATVEGLRSGLEALLVVPFTLAKMLAPQMKAREAGAMIFITSAMAARPSADGLIYGAGRTAATSMAASLAKELGPFNIQVNAIGPNFFKSDTYFSDERLRDSAGLQKVIRTQVPLRRLGRQDEMGALVSLIASQRAMPITGQFIGFTAGWLP